MWTEKERTCFITGHRRVAVFTDEETIRDRLETAIQRMVDAGFHVFICGMAAGAEHLASEVVLRIKERNPEIKLICAVPTEPEWQCHSILKREGVMEILHRADQVSIIRTWGSCRCSYLSRDAWMIDHSSACLAVFSGQEGRTSQLLEEARKKGIEPVIIDPKQEEKDENYGIV